MGEVGGKRGPQYTMHVPLYVFAIVYTSSCLQILLFSHLKWKCTIEMFLDLCISGAHSLIKGTCYFMNICTYMSAACTKPYQGGLVACPPPQIVFELQTSGYGFWRLLLCWNFIDLFQQNLLGTLAYSAHDKYYYVNLYPLTRCSTYYYRFLNKLF